MKEGIHPTFYPNAKVICACGNTWTTGATVEVVHTDVCSKCHPFFTGEQRIVDTEGQVDRFYKKLEAREKYRKELEERERLKKSPQLPVTELGLGSRIEGLLLGAGLETVGQVLERLSGGDAALLEIEGFGRKSLADLKRALRKRGYELPEAALEPQV